VNDAVPVPNFPAIFPPGYEVYITDRIGGVSVAPGLVRMLPRLMRWADVVHLSGTYSFPVWPTQALCALTTKPLVWTPHGALQASHEWARARHKTAKQVWERVCRLLIRKRSTVLHVTSESERAASQARLPGLSAEVIPHGVEIPSGVNSRTWRPDGALRILFLGRLDPKKGLENLLHAFGLLKDLALNLQVCGTGEAKYVAFLREQVYALGLVDRVQFVGHVDEIGKKEAFLNADVCVVPSYNENFCMVVAESLAHGVPVIASTGVPWSGLEPQVCGIWTSNSADHIADAIRRIRIMNLPEMGMRGRAWMQRDFSWAAAAMRMHALYRRLTGLNS